MRVLVEIHLDTGLGDVVETAVRQELTKDLAYFLNEHYSPNDVYVDVGRKATTWYRDIHVYMVDPQGTVRV